MIWSMPSVMVSVLPHICYYSVPKLILSYAFGVSLVTCKAARQLWCLAVWQAKALLTLRWSVPLMTLTA